MRYAYDHLNQMNENLLRTLWKRENNLLSANAIQRRLQSSKALIDRLELSSVLKGHEGCVNCLEWSADGSLLASGSDDFHVMLWDPYKKERVLNLRTNHTGNLFSLKFMPQFNNSRIVTGSADKSIYMYDINKSLDPILCCTCHRMRVKRLATAPDSPYVFWSSSEDGTIHQIDSREKHVCRNFENQTPLINLGNDCYPSAEAKCIAINPRRTELLAVGANDPYARLYDRRKMDFPSISNNLTQDKRIYTNISAGKPVMYFCPGHVTLKTAQGIGHESRAITYLTFNEAGTELLVNIGGEHIYLYDIENPKSPEFLNLPDYKRPMPNLELADEPFCLENPNDHASINDANAMTMDVDPMPMEQMPDSMQMSCTNPADLDLLSSKNKKNSYEKRKNGRTVSVSTKRRPLPDHIEVYKRQGNEFCEYKDYSKAIEKYSEAIALWPHSEVLYLNRATAYMRRLWYGDIYEAIRDCHQALRLDPSYTKAHFRLTRALLELGLSVDADESLTELLQRFPSYEVNHGVQVLAKDIKDSPQNGGHTLSSLESLRCDANKFSAGGISKDETALRCNAKDYYKRFVGHCNTKTDIKEANFFGYDGNFIVAGSDDGNFYLWDRYSATVKAVYRADGAIVNCVQVHPSICMLATSGIDREIKLWEPFPDSNEKPNFIKNIFKCVEDNQQKMKTDPFDLHARNSFCITN